MIRRVFKAIIGITQVVIGASVIVFTYIFSYNMFDTRNILNISDESASLYILLFLIFGLFAIISGVSLIQEWLKLRVEER